MSRMVWALALALLLGAALIGPVSGEAVVVGYLPEGRWGTGTFESDGQMFVMGGTDNTAYDEVLVYDPVSGVVGSAGHLPEARGYVSTVWTGSRAYVFGGFDSTNSCGHANIWSFDPATGSGTDLGDLLPQPLGLTSAVWTGQHAYIFGGWNGCGSDQVLGSENIVRFDPAEGTVTIMDAKLPTGRYGTSAVYDGDHVFVFGGFNGTSGGLDEIVRYDPATDAVSILSTRLPHTRGYMAAAWSGTATFLFGGHGSTGPSDEILRFVPDPASIAEMPDGLPSVRSSSSATWYDGSAYVFGGTYQDEVVRYFPGPHAPPEVTAGPGSLPAQVDLAWTASPGGAGAVDAYHVYRGQSPTAGTLIAKVPADTLGYTDDWLPDISWAPSGTLYYWVKAANEYGESSSSDVVACEPLRTLIPTGSNCVL